MNRFRNAHALICVLTLTASATTCWGHAPSGKTKNILFIISDDLKASVLPAYGNQVCKTPNLDQLAASGMVFERAYCQGLACAPSRPSFMRSIYPRSRASAPTIGEHFQQHGMHTARVGKVFHMPVPHAQLDGSDGKDFPECWTERYNTKSAETFSPGLYRLTELRHRDARDRGPRRQGSKPNVGDGGIGPGRRIGPGRSHGRNQGDRVIAAAQGRGKAVLSSRLASFGHTSRWWRRRDSSTCTRTRR